LDLVVEMDGENVLLSGNVLSVEDHSKVLSCRTKLEEIITLSAQKPLKINIAQLNAVSSVVLSLFLCLIREANKVSCELTFVNMSQGLFDMARVGGVESFFPRLNH